jgi:hypothetical protein
MPFQKGHKKIGGRPPGGTNKLTKTVKSRVIEVFEALQEHPTSNLQKWAEDFPHLFYPIAAKLIPTEVDANIENNGIVTIVVKRE